MLSRSTTKLALKPREAAAALGICERTLWQWQRDYSIPIVRIGTSIRYPVRELQEWLAKRASAEKT